MNRCIICDNCETLITSKPSLWKNVYKCDNCGNKMNLFENKKIFGDTPSKASFVTIFLLLFLFTLISWFVKNLNTNKLIEYLISVAIFIAFILLICAPISRLLTLWRYYPKNSDIDDKQ